MFQLNAGARDGRTPAPYFAVGRLIHMTANSRRAGLLINLRTTADLLCVLCALSALAHADELRVDLSRSGRNDTAAPHFIEWQFNPASPSTNFGEITVTLRKASGTVAMLDGGLYKLGIDYGARLACDGILLRDGQEGDAMEMVIAGLRPGRHTIATYHNSVLSADKALPPFNVFVNGSLTLTNLQPSIQVTNDYDVASAFVEVSAETGQDVVLKFVPTGPAPLRAVILNGFEIDTVDPRRKAIKPGPANDDEHVNADSGSATLTWISASAAATHDVYFGTNSEAVAKADRKPSLFKENQTSTRFAAANLNHFDAYFWRVDEVDAAGEVTPGELWRFRTRHLAFPSAEGYGRFARGGRGGRVIEVTNLNDSGPGSLRTAIEATGPRTVVFNVSGLITLESRLVIKNPYLTIAGQTAPSKGICVRKFNLGMMGTHDVVIRHLRVRPGNISGLTLDGMGMASSDHCIIDHCSISWTLDEAFSSRGAKNITLQRTLISEALNEAGHKKYPPGTQHGYAASIGGQVGSFHHNLLAHCAGRNWSLAGGLNQSGAYAGRLDIRNNVVYNWKHRATDGGAHEVNFVGNYYKPGPATTRFYALNAQYGGFPGSQRYFIEGNVMPGYFDVTNQSAGRIATTERGGRLPASYSPWAEAPFFDPHVKTQTANEAFTDVLANVGCNFPALDEHDARVIAEVRDGTVRFKGSKTGLSGLPDSQDDVGGWEDYPVVHRPANWDTDDDGMPDDWEKRAGLNPSDPHDGNQDRDGDGYTNLENYLNALVGEYSLAERKSRK